MSTTGGGPTFCLLLPVKRLVLSKTRLTSTTGSPERAALMRAFAYDVVEAALASPAVAHVYAVSEEPDLDVAGLTTLPDHGEGDLNAALRQGERAVRLRHPELGVAAMCADLPALRTDDLTAALRGALRPRWFVADAAGTGTTLLAAGVGVALDPHFGPGSARRHEESGAAPLRAEVTSLRQDVDTAADLRRARELGLGRHTRAVLDPG